MAEDGWRWLEVCGGVWRCLEVVLSSYCHPKFKTPPTDGDGWRWLVVVGVGWRWFMVMVEDG